MVFKKLNAMVEVSGLITYAGVCLSLVSSSHYNHRDGLLCGFTLAEMME